MSDDKLDAFASVRADEFREVRRKSKQNKNAKTNKQKQDDEKRSTMYGGFFFVALFRTTRYFFKDSQPASNKYEYLHTTQSTPYLIIGRYNRCTNNFITFHFSHDLNKKKRKQQISKDSFKKEQKSGICGASR